MITLIKADQQLIRREGAGLYERAGYRVLKPAYRAVWDSFIREVIRITQTSGFPAQKVIGTQQGDDSLFRAGPNAVFVTFLFIHHGHAWSQVHELLWTELLKGNITPQMYGVICESSNGYPLYENPVLYFASRPCADNGCRNIIKERLAEINANRYEIGLCSYEVMQEKFSSMLHYRRWCTRNRRTKKPFFDFQCELNFQGID